MLLGITGITRLVLQLVILEVKTHLSLVSVSFILSYVQLWVLLAWMSLYSVNGEKMLSPLNICYLPPEPLTPLRNELLSFDGKTEYRVLSVQIRFLCSYNC